MCKNCEHKLAEKYDPKDFEEELYREWEEKGYFKPSEDKTKKPYTIVMPPPNVTGKLHMGHALNGTMQDILIRYKRMAGFNALWIPGTDHASIATEVKVVEKMKKEGLSKQDLGRKGFIERAWEWTHEYGGEIESQQKKLGCSCDWSRKRFTLDEGLSDAVLESFVKLYEKGLIYKGKRMINWCPCCKTSISDAEVEYEEESTHLWHIKYQVKDSDEYIIVATTRPETMLGDTGVAVHPDDERYTHLIGKKVILPIVEKEIPIIADEFVEKEFGTGAVKLTPAHDMNDYQAGMNHNLEIVEVFDEEYNMGDIVPEYQGMDMYEARGKIVEKLNQLGVLVKTEDYTHSVGKCYRCHKTIEPKISEQWFVKMKPIAEPAIKAVKEKDIKFIPERYEKTYFHWMENIQDWCISRQLWWGHQIPAYYCEDCGEINVSKTKPEKCSKCGSKNLVQDEDTLDTWFSSALWPFSTLGWPNNTEDYNYFYPNSVLVTAYDIIFFWVARMVFSGLEYTGQKPFSDILIHGIVRDAKGRKMSKSLGNGIDPIEVIDQYGTDALRFSLILGVSAGNDIRYMTEKLEAARNFANKIWNAARFITMNLVSDEEIIKFKEENYNSKTHNHKEGSLKVEDKWIISKLETLTQEVTKNIEEYELGMALDKIYNFLWNEFCDWYIEIAKTRLYSENHEEKVGVCYVLDYVFSSALKLLHPFMPFVTSKIDSQLVKYSDEELMVSSWPNSYKETKYFEKEEIFIEKVKGIIVEVRNIRANMNVHPTKKAKLIFVTKEYKEQLEQAKGFIEKLAFGSEVIIKEDEKDIPQNAISILADGMKLFMPSEDLVDLEEEKERLEKEKERLEKEVERSHKMLSNPGFTSKAPESKIQEEREKLAKYEEMLKTTTDRLSKM